MQAVMFLFFVASGFCSLVYEVVWVRLAMAQFGVTSTVISVVLSVFMLGLALGSFLAGSKAVLSRLRTGRDFLRAYAVCELGIGSGAFLVPLLFAASRQLLFRFGEANSLEYHLLSAVLLGLAILPFTTLMGATFALAMGAMRAASNDPRTFSWLYLANVLGAAAGTLICALVLVELLGFSHTLQLTSVVNLAVFALALRRSGDPVFSGASAAAATERAGPAAGSGKAELVILFATGFASMGMEVCWTRLFTVYIGTFVYGFAAILAVYLIATYAGSLLYRRTRGADWSRAIFISLGVLALLPLVYADPRLLPHAHDIVRELPLLGLAIFPFCAALGYVTPLLIDRYGGGDPALGARGYAWNVLGCILGPLAAGYVLLPIAGERGALVLLSLVPLAIGLWSAQQGWQLGAKASAAGAAISLPIFLGLATQLKGYAETLPGAWVRRDHTATVVAAGKGNLRQLLVNGVGITNLTNITKLMAHFPLAELQHPPKRALVICFGMGTTFRSLVSWDGLEVTGVDLVPSVPQVFGYFHEDADAVVKNPRAHVVIDDGRRFLDRTRDQYDLITLDPPPPVEAAGSSLLYSQEFYRSAKARLAPGGILQQWLPPTDAKVVAAVARSVRAEFPHVRVFGDLGGHHFLASDAPLPVLTATQLFERLPKSAQKDLNEWGPGFDPRPSTDLGIDDDDESALFDRLLSQEIQVDKLIDAAPQLSAVTDDRPVNEYFLLRRAGLKP